MVEYCIRVSLLTASSITRLLHLVPDQPEHLFSLSDGHQQLLHIFRISWRGLLSAPASSRFLTLFTVRISGSSPEVTGTKLVTECVVLLDCWPVHLCGAGGNEFS